jgi:hypothetical protein
MAMASQKSRVLSVALRDAGPRARADQCVLATSLIAFF